MQNMMFISMTDTQLNLRDALYDMVLNGASEDGTKDIRCRLMQSTSMSTEEIQLNL